MEKFVKTKLGAAGFYTKQKNCRISITKIIVSEKFDKTKKNVLRSELGPAAKSGSTQRRETESRLIRINQGTLTKAAGPIRLLQHKRHVDETATVFSLLT